MTNKEILDNNPEKELIIDKSISDNKTKEISKKNTCTTKTMSKQIIKFKHGTYVFLEN